MFKRFFLVLRAWLGPNHLSLSREESESLLKQAQNEMRERHAQNRLRAIAAILEKNRLENEEARTKRQIEVKHSLASKLARRGDIEQSRKLKCDLALLCEQNDDLRKLVDEAIDTAEEAKREIRREDERIREKTREALGLKAQWLQSQRHYGDVRPLSPDSEAKAIVFALIMINLALLALLGLSFVH